MPLSNAEIEQLERFAGYGNPGGNLWFIGIEEGGEGEQNLRARLDFREIEDNCQAHIRLNLPDYHLGKRKIQRTWRGMCMIALALAGKEPHREAIRAYQAEQLGRLHGTTFLTELYPLPKNRTGHWPYREVIEKYASEEDYRNQVRPSRIALLRRLLAGFPSRNRLVVAYGKTCWPEFESIFPERRFERSEAFKVSVREGTDTIILAPHFTAREMNAGIHQLIHFITQNTNL